MNGSTATILSPHLDDAVLSCWHLIGESASVISVFTGWPPASNGVPAWWDRMTGATDPRRRMQERLAEDREALRRAGVEAVNVGFLDEQYRQSRQPVEPIAAALAELIPDRATLYAPAGIGNVTDHRLVRSAALQLAERGVEVRLYADLPHAIRYGWPSWVDGGGGRIDPAPWWEVQLRELLATGDRDPRPTVHRLDPEAQRCKLEAVLSYRTQLAALDVMFGGLARPGRLEYEVTWTLTGTGVGQAEERA